MDEQEFKVWLNEYRMYDVSFMFHQIVTKYREALARKPSEMEIALRAIKEFPTTDLVPNMDAWNMKVIAANALKD